MSIPNFIEPALRFEGDVIGERVEISFRIHDKFTHLSTVNNIVHMSVYCYKLNRQL